MEILCNRLVLKDQDQDSKELIHKGFITPLVINPSRDLTLISMIVTSSNNNNSLYRDRDRRERIITSLVTIANSEIGGSVLHQLLKYGATTLPELMEIVPTNIQSASRTIKALIQYDIVEQKGKVERPYRRKNQSGPKVQIFSLKGVDPQAVIEAQIRFAGLKCQEIVDPVQGKLDEAIALSKVYMKARGLTEVPSQVVLSHVLEELGIKINFNKLRNALVKEGFNP